MKVEGDGGIKRVGRSGVSWGSLSVCAKTPALWAGIPAPILGHGCGPGQKGPCPPGSRESLANGGPATASGKHLQELKDCHLQQEDESLCTFTTPFSVTFTTAVFI